MHLRSLFSESREWSQSEGIMGIKWNRRFNQSLQKRVGVRVFNLSTTACGEGMLPVSIVPCAL